MATRTAMPATIVTGDVWTTTIIDRVPGGWIGDVEVTANQGSITTEADLTGLSLTVTVNTSRRIKISAAITMQNGTNSNGAILRIKESSTVLKECAKVNVSNAVGENMSTHVVITPSAGSHTYKVSLTNLIGGTVVMTASGTNPASLLVEDIGPA